jgi:hypothetical protein
LAWDDFAAPTGGFERSSEALSKSLIFSPSLLDQIEGWPEEREELRKKLKKSQKGMTKFDWDTTPSLVPGVTGASVSVIEEAFVDVWSDLLLGGGWTDYSELTFREASWVLVSPRRKCRGGGWLTESGSCSWSFKLFLWILELVEGHLERMTLVRPLSSSALRSSSRKHTKSNFWHRNPKSWGCSVVQGLRKRRWIFQSARSRYYRQHKRATRQSLMRSFAVPRSRP